MRVLLLRRAYGDLFWFRKYYKNRFPEGAGRALARYRQAIERLGEMPLVGHPVAGRQVREYPISRTPFLLIYRIVGDRVEILRVWDARAERVDGWIGDGD